MSVELNPLRGLRNRKTRWSLPEVIEAINNHLSANRVCIFAFEQLKRWLEENNISYTTSEHPRYLPPQDYFPYLREDYDPDNYIPNLEEEYKRWRTEEWSFYDIDLPQGWVIEMCDCEDLFRKSIECEIFDERGDCVQTFTWADQLHRCVTKDDYKNLNSTELALLIL